jgi:hypothetical protein
MQFLPFEAFDDIPVVYHLAIGIYGIKIEIFSIRVKLKQKK